MLEMIRSATQKFNNIPNKVLKVLHFPMTIVFN